MTAALAAGQAGPPARKPPPPGLRSPRWPPGRPSKLVVNPDFLVSVVLAAWLLWTYSRSTAPVTEIGEVVGYPAILLGAFGMMAMFWLTRSMRASEPVTGVTPVSLPMRTAALYTAAAVPFACGILALIAFAHIYPVSGPLYGAFSTPAGIAILTGQIAIRRSAARCSVSPLAAGYRSPAPRSVLFLIIFGWVNLVTILTVWHPGPAAPARAPHVLAVRLLEPPHRHRPPHHGLARVALVLPRLAARPVHDRGAGGRPRRAGGRVRVRIVQALMFVLAAAVDLLVLAGTGGFSRGHRVMTGLVLRAGAWPECLILTGAAALLGGFGAAFPAKPGTTLIGICFKRCSPPPRRSPSTKFGQPGRRRDAPTGPARRTRIRATALLAPLAVGVLVLAAAACWSGAALGGHRSRPGPSNVLLRVRCGVRGPHEDRGAGRGGQRVGVVLVLMAPSIVPPVARWIRTFPAPGGQASRPRTTCGGSSSRCVRGGHRRIGRWPKPAPVDVQCSVIRRRRSPRHPLRESASSTVDAVTMIPAATVAASARPPTGVTSNPGSKRMRKYETVRRALVNRVLRVLIATAAATAAVTAGLLTSLAAPPAVAIVVGVTAAVGAQAIQGALSMLPTGGCSARGWPALRTSTGSDGA